MRHASPLAPLVVVVALATACASGDGGEDAGEHVHANEDAGDTAGACIVEGGVSRLDFASGRALTFTTDPSPMPLNALFTMSVTAEPAMGQTLDDGLVLTVDATMPAHGHGMNTTPSVTSTTNGAFTVAGMQLHMPGEWKMTFELAVDEGGGATPTILDDGELTVDCAE